MTSEEYQWHINLVQDRYQYLNLTYEQAGKVYLFEQEKVNHSDKYFFSTWEEWDYEQTTFREILNDGQLKKYETILKENIQRYEQSLTDEDKEKTNEIAYNEELLSFYEEKILPDFLKDSLLRFGCLSTYKGKIEYLRTEYKHFLNETKKEILTNHFRHNRTFKPNELKASLLCHKLSYVLPDYTSFRLQMDEPTKAVVNYLNTKIRYLPDNTEELLTRKFNELKEFNDANFKKHYGELQGWHVVVERLAPEEEKEHRAMMLLLLDEAKYDC